MFVDYSAYYPAWYVPPPLFTMKIAREEIIPMRIETFWKAESVVGLILHAKVAKPREERVQEVAFGVTVQSWEWLFLADRRRGA